MRQKGLQARLGLRWSRLRVQPRRLILWRQYDGHAVVDVRDQAVGLRGNDGKAAPGAPLPILPHAPDPRKGKRLAGLQGDPIEHLALAGALPFVKTVRQHQTALRPEGLPKIGSLNL